MPALTTVKVLYPSSIGLYPVQRHKFPEKTKYFPDVVSVVLTFVIYSCFSFTNHKCHNSISCTLESLLHVTHLGGGVISQQSVHGHDEPRSTETTLRAVGLRYSLLNTQKTSWNRLNPGKWNTRALTVTVISVGRLPRDHPSFSLNTIFSFVVGGFLICLWIFSVIQVMVRVRVHPSVRKSFTLISYIFPKLIVLNVLNFHRYWYKIYNMLIHYIAQVSSGHLTDTYCLVD